MFANMQGWHLIIVLVVILLLFGATRLPALARSIGQSTKIFRQEMKDDTEKDGEDGSSTSGSATDQK